MLNKDATIEEKISALSQDFYSEIIDLALYKDLVKTVLATETSSEAIAKIADALAVEIPENNRYF